MISPSPKEFSFKNTAKYTAILIGLWYLTLCFFHYISQKPLWNDELAVKQSLDNFTSAKDFFTRPLYAVQVFPRFYLLVIYYIAQFFQSHVLGLRMISFIAMCAAFLLWARLMRRELKDHVAYLTFLLCWCASVPMIYYAAELKQYSMDVLVAVLFLLFLQNQRSWQQIKRKKLNITLVFLPALGLVSYPAFLFCFFPFYNLVRSVRRNKALITSLILFICSVLVFVSLSFYFDMRLAPVSDLNVPHSGGHGDYMISFESIGDFFKTFGEGVNNLFSRFLADHPRILRKITRCFTGFGLIYLIYGFLAHIKKEQYYLTSVKTIAFVLFWEMFLLGALRKYPFTVPRTSLFYAPIVFYLSIQGIALTRRIHKYLYWFLQGAFITFLLILNILIARIILSPQYLGGQSVLW